MKGKLLRAGLLLVPVLLGGWAFYLEPSSLELRRSEVALPGWPNEQAGLEVALLSDLHIGSPFYGTDQLEKVVERVSAARPHLVLLAGDYVIDGVLGGNFVPPETTASVLGNLEAPLGVYAVLGNHDWWYDGPRVREALEREGIRVLDNESERIEAGGFDFWLAGLGDFWESRGDVSAVLDGIPQGEPVLAFTHNPDLFPEIPERVALTMAGHTHGGQVRFPFFGTPVVPSRYGSRYAQGHVVEGGRHLFVTSGLGTSIIPVRFRVPPEIALLRIGSGVSGRPRPAEEVEPPLAARRDRGGRLPPGNR
jgi:predicted MPP superfamily phosphohydrolase